MREFIWYYWIIQEIVNGFFSNRNADVMRHFVLDNARY